MSTHGCVSHSSSWGSSSDIYTSVCLPKVSCYKTTHKETIQCACNFELMIFSLVIRCSALWWKPHLPCDGMTTKLNVACVDPQLGLSLLSYVGFVSLSLWYVTCISQWHCVTVYCREEELGSSFTVPPTWYIHVREHVDLLVLPLVILVYYTREFLYSNPGNWVDTVWGDLLRTVQCRKV